MSHCCCRGVANAIAIRVRVVFIPVFVLVPVFCCTANKLNAVVVAVVAVCNK